MWLWIVLPIVIIAVLCAVGFASYVVEARKHNQHLEKVSEFRVIFVNFANSEFKDFNLVGQLQRKSTSVEEALGADNIIYGATAFHMLLSGVPAIPFLLREITMKCNDWLWQKDCYSAVVLVDNLLMRHIGRREARLEQIRSEASNPFVLFYRGWRSVASIPLYILSIFGLIGARSVQTAQNSFAFKVFNFISLLATVSAAIFAYFADKSAIDQTVMAFFK